MYIKNSDEKNPFIHTVKADYKSIDFISSLILSFRLIIQEAGIDSTRYRVIHNSRFNR